MSKKVTIPEGHDPIVIEIGARRYTYPAGATVTVPDEVAALIEDNRRLVPREDPDIMDTQPISRGEVKKRVAFLAADVEHALQSVVTDYGLPEVDAEDNGKVLGVTGGAWAAVETSGGGGSGLPTVSAADNGKMLGVSSGAWAAVKTRLDVTFSVSVDAGTGAVSVSANGTTFADIAAAFAAQQDLVAWIVLPTGAVLTTRSYLFDSVSPTSVSFMATADLADVGNNEAYAPTFYQIDMTAEGASLRIEPLKLAT